MLARPSLFRVRATPHDFELKTSQVCGFPAISLNNLTVISWNLIQKPFPSPVYEPYVQNDQGGAETFDTNSSWLRLRSLGSLESPLPETETNGNDRAAAPAADYISSMSTFSRPTLSSSQSLDFRDPPLPPKTVNLSVSLFSRNKVQLYEIGKQMNQIVPVKPQTNFYVKWKKN